MNRYLLVVYQENDVILSIEFRSITSVCKFIDHFEKPDLLNIWFDLVDIIKDKSISVKELMRIWHQ